MSTANETVLADGRRGRSALIGGTLNDVVQTGGGADVIRDGGGGNDGVNDMTI